jgi:hypothetical protein
MSLEHFQSPRFQQAIDQVYAVRPLLNAARISRGPVRMGSVTADNACVVAFTLVFDLERKIEFALLRSKAVREADPEGYREHLDNLRRQQLPDPRFVLKHLHVAGDELRREGALDLSALKAEIQLECDAATLLPSQPGRRQPGENLGHTMSSELALLEEAEEALSHAQQIVSGAAWLHKTYAETPEWKPVFHLDNLRLAVEMGRRRVARLSDRYRGVCAGTVECGPVSASSRHEAAIAYGSWVLETAKTPEQFRGSSRPDADAWMLDLEEEKYQALKVPMATAPRTAGDGDARFQTTHGPDFRQVRWFGVDYHFTAAQAAVVKQLWDARKNGTPEVGQETLLSNASLETKRLADLFKAKGIPHEAWGTMIVDGRTKGTYRLQEPSPRPPV